MARKSRIRSSLNLYHIIIRGINKQDIFLDEQDKNKFLKELVVTKEKLKFKLYAYVIMPNHVHLVIKEENVDISKIMHRIKLSYSEYLNAKYNRVGHVFQGRFNSKNIEDEEYLKTVIRYIHLNPDKVGIGKYNKYKWSSYNSYLNNEKDKLVDTLDILNLFNIPNDERIIMFEKFHEEKSKYNYTEEYSEFEIEYRLDDNVLIDIITEEMKISNIYEIQKLNNQYRDYILEMLIKIRGTTASQISRITGISINVIQKIKNKINKNK